MAGTYTTSKGRISLMYIHMCRTLEKTGTVIDREQKIHKIVYKTTKAQSENIYMINKKQIQVKTTSTSSKTTIVQTLLYIARLS